MSLTITHAFTSPVADDPVASTAGEVTPTRWNAAHTITGYINYPNVINVFDYLSTAEQADVTNRTGLLDVTHAFVSAAAAIPSGGAQIIVPAGRYVTTGGVTLANPFTMVGDGGCVYVDAQGITQIECNTNAVAMFTTTCHNGSFDKLNIQYTGGTTAAAGSSAIKIAGASAEARMYCGTNLSIIGFYDSIDQTVGEGCLYNGVLIKNSVHYGMRMRNTVTADSGDNRIVDCYILPLSTAAAGIRYESGGGLSIIGCKLLTGVTGISGALTGASSQLTIADTNIEGVTAEPIIIDFNNWGGLLIDNCYLANTGSSTNSAINLNHVSYGKIGTNVLIGNSPAAITINNSSNVTISPQTTSAGWTALFAGSGNSNIVNTFSTPLIVTSSTPSAANFSIINTSTTGYSGFDLYNSSNALIGGFEYGNASATSPTNDVINFFSLNKDFVCFFGASATTEVFRIKGNGNILFGGASPTLDWNITHASRWTFSAPLRINGTTGGGAESTYSAIILGINAGTVAAVQGTAVSNSWSTFDFYDYNGVFTAGFGYVSPGEVAPYGGNFLLYTVGKDLAVITGGSGTIETFRVTSTGNTTVGNAAIATNAANGFLYIPTCAGTPTGTPTAYTGRIPMVYDTTNHQFWFYDSGWKQPKTPAGAATVTWQ